MNVGMYHAYQLLQGTFDIAVHLAKGTLIQSGHEAVVSDCRYLDAIDTTQLWNDLRQRICLTKVAKPLPGQCNFQHLVRGYEVGYYGFVLILIIILLFPLMLINTDTTTL